MALHLFNIPKPFPLTRNLPRHPIHGTTTMKHRIQCLAGSQDQSQTIERRSANYQPAAWSNDVLESLKKDIREMFDGEVEKMCNEERARELEEEVKRRIYDDEIEPLALLELVDDIQNLGLGYRFEKNIKKTLQRRILQGTNMTFDDSLYAAALRFRILREHSFEVSQDVFRSFMDENGSFRSELCKDVKGMLSLYEASYHAFQEENLLQEANTFTKNLDGDIDQSLKELVNLALELPLHQRMRRLEARWRIDEYKRREGADCLLLELAILDFNKVQSTHQQDLQEVSRWWGRLGLSSKLQFARDRLTESFFWSVGMVFEPQYSNSRKGITKVFTLVTAMDDIYDVYGSLDELEKFTEAVERWDVNMVENLPDYMKLFFLALYNTTNDMAYDSLKEQGEFTLPYLVKAWSDLCKVFLQEAKWFYTKYTPTFEEYLENGWRSASGLVHLVHAYVLMSKNITKEALEALEKEHELLRWPNIIFRLANDMASRKAEVERGESTNSISCYMNETGVSEDDACEHLKNLIEENWRKMNMVRAVDSSSPFEKPFVEMVINLARIAQCTYQYGDSHSAPDDIAKKRVLSLIIQPIPLMERKKLV